MLWGVVIFPTALKGEGGDGEKVIREEREE